MQLIQINIFFCFQKKLEKVYADTIDWLEKNRDSTDMSVLEAKIKEVNDDVAPIIDKVMVRENPTISNSNITNPRSKPATPSVNK